MTEKAIDELLQKFSDRKFQETLDTQTDEIEEAEICGNIRKILKLELATEIVSIPDAHLNSMAANGEITEEEYVRFKAYQCYLEKEIVKDALFAIKYIFD